MRVTPELPGLLQQHPRRLGGNATSTSPIGSITSTGSGIGFITAGRCGSSPVGPATFNASGYYFDVAVGSPNGFSSVTTSDRDL